MPVQGQRIVVVGASGVLGSAIAQRLAAGGAIVEGTSSTPDGADRVPAVVKGRYVVDLEDPSSIANAATAITAAGGALDGVVIASGIVAFGPIDQTPPEVADQLMQVNHLGPASLIAQLLPALRGCRGRWLTVRRVHLRRRRRAGVPGHGRLHGQQDRPLHLAQGAAA